MSALESGQGWEPNMRQLLTTLRKFDAIRDTKQEGGRKDETYVRQLPVIQPEFAKWDVNDTLQRLLPGRLGKNFAGVFAEALHCSGVSQLYDHQYRALKSVLGGNNIVLVSPTASGKTLCFSIPVLYNLTIHPQAKALMVYPMKALANDQRAQLEQIAKFIPNRAPTSWLYDGDTPEHERKLLREKPPSIILTNPEFLHLSFLGHWEKWSEQFLKQLQYVIIDEIHEYRGFFGTNMALLLRRFLLRLHNLGVQPRIILSSATCANPDEHARRLTGLDCDVIRDRSGMRPHRNFIFVAPDIPDFRYHDILLLRVSRGALAFLSHGLSTIVFCPSRSFVERATTQARKDAAEFGLDPQQIVPYKAGYTADERREIESGLQTGKYKVVFATNALEIGINIGRLDACILAGFPDNVMSAWQRIGRAGRSWDKESYVLYFAQNNPVDQFYARNIDAFLDKPLDQIMVGVDNDELIKRHVPCVLFENGPLPKRDDGYQKILGDAFHAAYKTAAKKHKPAAGAGHVLPHQRCPMRSVAGQMWTLKLGEREIGTLSDQQKFREAYIGAVYHHLGKSYLVEAHGAKEIFLKPAPPNVRTEASFYTIPNIEEVIRGLRWNEHVAAYYGSLRIYENFAGYRLIDDDSGAVLDDSHEQIARQLKVRAFWLCLEDSDKHLTDDDIMGLRALEQFLRVGSPFVIPCDRHDYQTLSSTNNAPSVFFYETMPGGIGLAEKLHSIWPSVVVSGMEIAEKCSCQNGCPRCIHSNRFDKDVDTVKKPHGLKFGKKLVATGNQSPGEKYSHDSLGWEECSLIDT